MTKDEFIELVHLKLLGEPELIVNDFIDYWIESDLRGKKMRFQGQKFFDVKRRFATWIRLSKKYPNKETLTPHELTLLAYKEAGGG